MDSHLDLPVVTADRAALARDAAPFRALVDLPMAMTAHIVYRALDPDRPATTSRTVIDEIVRGEIGFDGLLLSDDLSMEALRGTLGERAAAASAAGCDILLHCNGRMEEARAVAAVAPSLSGRAAERAASALARRVAPEPPGPRGRPLRLRRRHGGHRLSGGGPGISGGRWSARCRPMPPRWRRRRTTASP